MATDMSTIQSNIKNHTNDNLLNYALFMGGLNVTHDVLANYDPFIGGRARLFMVRKPLVLEQAIPNKLNKFKHILEYGNTGVNGIGDMSVDFQEISGGYLNRKFSVPTSVTDDTDTITIKVYEFSGGPVREVIYTWVNSVIDTISGLTHYNGIDEKIARIQSNHTAEFIYCVTDNTGDNVEYACLLANCFPTTIKNDHFNYNAGEHNIVEYEVPFKATKYEGMQINKIATSLLKRYKILSNSLNFYSGIEDSDDALGKGRGYDIKTGMLKEGAAQTKSPMVQ